mmetsp:Transcript_5026/g.11733  ORF Transcript_5026/g.11733 Transcript_5026/m.11733 type:complete len:268 (+) Transcript_5026:908-1711(+)
MVNDEFESATMPLEHMGDLTSILGSHVYSIARDAHKSINSYGELLLRKPSDPIRVAFEEKHAWRFLHVLSSISAGMQKGLFNNNTEERMVNLMKSTIEKLELGADKGKGDSKDGRDGGNKTTDIKQAQRETAPHSLQTVLPPSMPSHFTPGPFRGRGGFRARGYSRSRPYDGGRGRGAPPRSDDFDGWVLVLFIATTELINTPSPRQGPGHGMRTHAGRGMHECMSPHTYLHTYLHTCIRLHTYTYIYVHTYIYVRMRGDQPQLSVL